MRNTCFIFFFFLFVSSVLSSKTASNTTSPTDVKYRCTRNHICVPCDDTELERDYCLLTGYKETITCHPITPNTTLPKDEETFSEKQVTPFVPCSPKRSGLTAFVLYQRPVTIKKVSFDFETSHFQQVAMVILLMVSILMVSLRKRQLVMNGTDPTKRDAPIPGTPSKLGGSKKKARGLFAQALPVVSGGYSHLKDAKEEV
ncbi:hypothetical protein PROFUN_02710 [Planoprotostelium fungivorum]|uniref:Uncharacterized protein n=1 Tax=Planoprotostelium fungivorum TaxID=1890364 RepID=A0A2P6NVI6_9EUKA|nr:hypothetical protein PROFUN_10104 [Planoprotostelium fungivorum]PRP87973.1 hypothetical protein PROFUN_02710 [Planoprotostelium fungivorum]